jgi:hypothetical protein
MAAAPPLDVLASGELDGQTATYRIAVRNHGLHSTGPVDVHVEVPAEARLDPCWVGFQGLGRCATDGRHLTRTLPLLSGGKTTAGPFVVVDVSS